MTGARENKTSRTGTQVAISNRKSGGLMKEVVRKSLFVVGSFALIIAFQNCAEPVYSDARVTELEQAALIETQTQTQTQTQNTGGGGTSTQNTVAKSCLDAGEEPFKSGSLIGTAYNFCATNASEIEGISTGVTITSNAPSTVHSSYHIFAAKCCSDQLRVTAVASGCSNGVFAASCL